MCSKPALQDQSEISFISGVLSRREDNQTSLKEHLYRADSTWCHNRSSVLPLLHKFVYLGKEKKVITCNTTEILLWRGTQLPISWKLQIGILDHISVALRAPVSSWVWLTYPNNEWRVCVRSVPRHVLQLWHAYYISTRTCHITVTCHELDSIAGKIFSLFVPKCSFWHHSVRSLRKL